MRTHRFSFIIVAALAMLAACGQHQPSSLPASESQHTTNAVPAVAPAVSPTPFAYSWRVAGEGKINGADNSFKATNTDVDTKPSAGTYDGDLAATDPGARAGGGGQGPTGNIIDGVPCNTTMPNTYHVHAFVGVYVNGKELAVPDAIGMDHALGDMYDKYSGWYNEEIYATCFYHIHTHDASGLVHMETSQNAPITKPLFNLGQFFDLWGINVTASQFGSYSGTVTVYTSLNSASVPCHTTAQCEVGANQYRLWTESPRVMPLYSHEAIWIEVGTGNPDSAHLPGVAFAIQQ